MYDLEQLEQNKRRVSYVPGIILDTFYTITRLHLMIILQVGADHYSSFYRCREVKQLAQVYAVGVRDGIHAGSPLSEPMLLNCYFILLLKELSGGVEVKSIHLLMKR